MSKPETALSKAIRDALTSAGFWVERINSGKVKVKRGWLYGAKVGTPDILVIAPYGWLEVKIDTGSQSPEQLEWQEKALARGVRFACVRSVEGALREVASWAAEERAKGAA